MDVAASSIVELPDAESHALLQLLFDISARSHLQRRHRWADGDVAVCDNRCTQHRVAADYDQLRRIERVSVVARAEAPRSSR